MDIVDRKDYDKYVELECGSCGERISSEEYEAGDGICYACINDEEEI